MAEGEGRDGKQGTIDNSGLAWDSSAGEVEAVVVHGAEAREHEWAVLVFLGEFGVVEEARDVEFLPFDEDGADLAGFGEA